MHFKDRYSYLSAVKETVKMIQDLRCFVWYVFNMILKFVIRYTVTDKYIFSREISTDLLQYINKSQIPCSTNELPGFQDNLRRIRKILKFHWRLLAEWNNVIRPKVNSKGETPVHLACKAKKLEDVVSLIKLGEDVNIKDHAGWLPLHDAILTGSKEIVVALLNAGSFVNAPGMNYDTPMYVALVNNQTDICGTLLAYGVDMNLKNFDGIRPL